MPDSPNLSEIQTTTLRNRSARKQKRAMPLIKSPSKKAFSQNIGEMVDSGHPIAQAVAASYATKRAASKKDNTKKSHDSAPWKHSGARNEPHNKQEVYQGNLSGPAGPHGVEGLLKGAGGPTEAMTSRPFGFDGTSSHTNRGQSSHVEPGFARTAHCFSHARGNPRPTGKSGHRIGKR